MSIGPIFVGTTPTLTDVIAEGDGSLPDLTGSTIYLVYVPKGLDTPEVTILATANADQVLHPGSVMIQLGSPMTDAIATFTAWWRVLYGNGALLESDNFDLPVVSHLTGGTPYLTSGLFRRLTRVKQSRLGIALSGANVNADEFLQYELDRAAAYVEFVTGQPATDSTLPLQATYVGTLPTSSALRTMLMQAIQMRMEQILFQSQNSYLDDASDDVVSSISVGGFSQTKSDSARRGEQRQLNSWQALSNVLWLLMTPDRYSFWITFLSSDPHLQLGAAYSFENTLEPSAYFSGGYGYSYGYGGAYGGADEYIGSHIGIGGWQGGLGGLPGGPFPLQVD